MKKKSILLVILIGIISLIIGICVILKNKKLDGNFDYSESGIAIMIDENGDGNYVEYKSIDGSWPSDDYYFRKSECDNDASIRWNYDTNSIVLSSVKNDSCTLYFDKKAYDYDYKGEVQEFIAPVTGDYKIQLWGAQGGDLAIYHGGKGGYTEGIINLTKGTKLYVYVGNTSTESRVLSFNGGGSTNSYGGYGAPGGGATDVRLEKGDGTWNDFAGLKSRIMVAGGGGGADNRNLGKDSYWYGAGNGGYGGGLIGGTGQAIDTQNPETGLAYGYTISKGGTQTSGGIVSGTGGYENQDCTDVYGHFGYAGSEQCGGGGGYYGGGGSWHSGAGGGSSYISGYKGCVAIKDTSSEENLMPKDNCTEATAQNNIECSYHYSGKIFNSTVMKSGEESMPSPNGGQETGHSGNGHARISLVNIQKTYNYEYKGEVQEFTAPVTGDYKIQLWGAQGGDIDNYKGGKGGYTEGVINLKVNDKLYIYVGGQGSNSQQGGYNGGSDLNSGQSAYGSSGGGATDVRLDKGSGDWKNIDGLKSRIMVAAGGGGANNRNRTGAESTYFGAGDGGYGGGLIGGAGISINHTHPNGATYGWSTVFGGTQTSGGRAYWNKVDVQIDEPDTYGKFGYSIPSQSTGGGGYYGGGGRTHSGGGGGSSYISGYLGCVAIEKNSTEEKIITRSGCTEESAKSDIKCSYHYSNKIFEEANMIAGNEQMLKPDGETEIGHSGNGYARITLIN